MALVPGTRVGPYEVLALLGAGGMGEVLYATGGGYGGGISQIAWYDRTGKLLSAVGAAGSVGDPAISPDEKSVAFRRAGPQGADIWLRDLSRAGSEAFFRGRRSYGVVRCAPGANF